MGTKLRNREGESQLSVITPDRQNVTLRTPRKMSGHVTWEVGHCLLRETDYPQKKASLETGSPTLSLTWIWKSVFRTFQRRSRQRGQGRVETSQFKPPEKSCWEVVMEPKARTSWAGTGK